MFIKEGKETAMIALGLLETKQVISDTLAIAIPRVFKKSDTNVATSYGQERVPTLALDFVVVLLMSLGVFMANRVLRVFVAEPIAKKMLIRKSAIVISSKHSTKNARKNTTMKKSERKQCLKFSQSALEALTYSIFFWFGLNVVWTREWFWPSEEWWRNQSDFRTESGFRGYYLLYVARYCAEIISVSLEYERKDKREMLLHHFSTVGLIAISYMYGFTRVGAIIMLLLDPADVPLHCAKLFKYVADARKMEASKKEGRTARTIQVGKRCQFMADVLFGIFMVTFFITRLVLYPYVVWSSQFECRKFVNVYKNTPLLFGYWTCILLLYIVLALQAYWFYLIMKVAIKVITKGEAEDVRSDDEDDDDDDDDDENELEGSKRRKKRN